MGNPYWSARQVQNLFVQYEGTVEVCFVQCIDCPAEKTLSEPGGTKGVSDAEAEAYFRRHGWTIKPTRCPACAKKHEEGER